jgi:hypothetical protein
VLRQVEEAFRQLQDRICSFLEQAGNQHFQVTMARRRRVVPSIHPAIVVFPPGRCPLA